MTSDKLQKLVDEQTSEHERALTRIAERGGLPASADIDAVYGALNRAFDRIEPIAWRVGDVVSVADSFVMGEPAPPFPVTLEHIGVLALLADDIEGRAEDFLEFARTFRNAIGAVDSLRRSLELAEERRNA